MFTSYEGIPVDTSSKRKEVGLLEPTDIFVWKLQKKKKHKLFF